MAESAAATEVADDRRTSVYTIPVVEFGGRTTEPIKACEFLRSWASHLMVRECTNEVVPYSKEELAELAEIPKNLVGQLYAECCPDNTLYDEADGLKPFTMPRVTDIPEGTSLLCLEYQKAEVQKRQDLRYARNVCTKLKYSNRSNSDVVHGKVSKDKEAMSQKPDVTMPNVLYTVRVHKPALVNVQKLGANDDLDVLGDQELTELRDAIRCSRDFEFAGELSSNPDAITTAPRSGELFKSAMFYIEGTLYDDLRDPTNREYSKTILDWMATRSQFVLAGLPKKASMSGVKFADIPIRIGQPYLYVHQGDCEHCVVFTDLRVLHPDDCLYRDAYPLLVTHRSVKKTPCLACLDNVACWVVKNFLLSPQDPAYYCDECFRMFHYNPDGTPIGEFQAYAYSDISSMT